MYKKLLVLLICLFMSISLFCANVYAEDNEVKNEKEYKPLDIVVVIDESGSMRSSDPNETAKEAVRMLVNMMPAEDSRVGIISFNTNPTIRTEGKYGDESLIKIRDFAGLESVRDAINEVEYKGDTGIGNALYAASELLSRESDDSRTKVIMLFTDGIDDFGNRIDADLELAKCQKNETEAISWAKNNDCKIYCVGYDYVLQNGESSMGENGEGIIKLQNMADSTEGEFNVVHDVSEIEELLINFLASACDLNYKIIETIPGDGNRHEATIPISPSVIEANIRIAGADTVALESGAIHLYDPNGDEVSLENSDNVRVDADAMAVSIKVIVPTPGDWIVSVEGIYNEINIGLLEHYKMNISSTLTFPEGNPEGVAYSNDVVGIKTWLSYEGETLEESAIYDAVTSAKARCVSRANDDEILIDLVRNGNTFVGEFTIPQDSYYDIYIRLDWDTVYREDTLTVKSSNKPLELLSGIEGVEVNKGKSVNINNVFQFVADDEGDEISLNDVRIGNDEIASIVVNDDDIIITGKKWGSTLVDVEFIDSNGNTVTTSFQVDVNDPLALALIIGTFALLIVGVVLFVYISYRLSFRVGGKVRVALIQKRKISNGEVVDIETYYSDFNRRESSNGEKYSIDNYIDSSNDLLQNEDILDFFGARDNSSTNEENEDYFKKSIFDNEEKEDEIEDLFKNTQDDGYSLSREEEIEKSESFTQGEFLLSTIQQKNMYSVFERFGLLYKNYMTDGDRVKSELSEKVINTIADYLTPLKNVTFTGSPFGRFGVDVHFNELEVRDSNGNVCIKGRRKQTITLMNPKIEKKKISTKKNGNKLVVFKLGVDITELDSENKKEEIYFEIEYINN